MQSSSTGACRPAVVQWIDPRVPQYRAKQSSWFDDMQVGRKALDRHPSVEQRLDPVGGGAADRQRCGHQARIESVSVSAVILARLAVVSVPSAKLNAGVSVPALSHIAAPLPPALLAIQRSVPDGIRVA